LDVAGGGWKMIRGRYCEEGEGKKRSQYKSSISSENRSRQGCDGDTTLRSDVSTLCGRNEVTTITDEGREHAIINLDSAIHLGQQEI
jgi:hypothetical protein